LSIDRPRTTALKARATQPLRPASRAVPGSVRVPWTWRSPSTVVASSQAVTSRPNWSVPATHAWLTKLVCPDAVCPEHA
jgi:hypothetical protein